MNPLAEEAPVAANSSVQVVVFDRVGEGYWDMNVAGAEEGSYRQTAMFARHQENRYRETPLFLQATDGEDKVLGLLLVRIGAPFSWGLRRRAFAHLGLALMAGLAPCMYWGDGPVLLAGKNRRAVYEALLDRALIEARDRGCIGVEAWPAFYGVGHGQERDWIYDQFVSRGFEVAPNHTFVVDLRNGEEALWQGMRKEGRNKVRRALKQNVEIIELRDDGDLLATAHEIVAETATRNGVASMPYEELRQALLYHRSQGVYRAYLALHHGRGVAYQHMTCFNRVVQLGGVAYSDYSRRENIYGNDLLQWHVLKTAVEMGAAWVDYGGANPDAEDEKSKGIFRFKAKWGGELVRNDRFRLAADSVALTPRGLLGRLYKRIGGKDYRPVAIAADAQGGIEDYDRR